MSSPALAAVLVHVAASHDVDDHNDDECDGSLLVFLGPANEDAPVANTQSVGWRGVGGALRALPGLDVDVLFLGEALDSGEDSDLKVARELLEGLLGLLGELDVELGPRLVSP